MKLIVGLGNPGQEYKNTRHNIGFKVVEKTAQNLNLDFKKDKFTKSFLARDLEKSLLIAKPLTFMNLSGEAVRDLVKNNNILYKNLLVVYDDLDLEFARLKFSFGKSCGGHKGVEGIIENIGTLKFCRLRFGIGRDKAKDASDFVLSHFNKEESKKIEDTLEKAALACIFWQEFGIEKTMDRYNELPR